MRSFSPWSGGANDRRTSVYSLAEMASSPVKLLFALLVFCAIGWVVFVFAARLLAWFLSRVLGASVAFCVAGCNCLRDVTVKFRKGRLMTWLAMHSRSRMQPSFFHLPQCQKLVKMFLPYERKGRLSHSWSLERMICWYLNGIKLAGCLEVVKDFPNGNARLILNKKLQSNQRPWYDALGNPLLEGEILCPRSNAAYSAYGSSSFSGPNAIADGGNICYKCQQPGNWARECPRTNPPIPSYGGGSVYQEDMESNMLEASEFL